MVKLAEEIWQSICQQAQRKQLFCRTFEREVSYTQLKSTIEKLSGYFSSLKETPKKIAIMSSDDFVVAEIALACICNGIAFTVMDKLAKPNRINALLAQFNGDISFIDESYSEVKSPNLIITVKPPRSKLFSRFIRQSSPSSFIYPELLDEHIEIPPLSEVQDMAYILYTSGTTSEPKGVVISHFSLSSHLSTLKTVFGYNQDSRILNSLNLSHADGILQGPILSAYLGSCWSSLKDYQINETEKIFDMIVAHQISHFITVPIVLSIIDKLAMHDDAFTQQNFKTIVSTGGFLDKSTWENIENRYHTTVCNMYGLTETTTGGLFAGPDIASRVPGTVGKAVDVEVCIGPSPEHPVTNGKKGLLWLKGNSIMQGYHDNDEATKAVFYKGWLNTGDIACQKNSLISIVGREKELVNVGGYAVNPQEINEVLLQDNQIIQAYTSTRKDLVYGDYLVSLVVSESDRITITNLIAFCRRNLEPHKVPRNIYVTNSLPIGRSGKINIAHAENIMSLLDNIENNDNRETTLINIAAKIFNLDSSQLDINSGVHNTPGWDSLGHLMLITKIEQHFSINLSTNDILKIERLSDLSSFIK